MPYLLTGSGGLIKADPLRCVLWADKDLSRPEGRIVLCEANGTARLYVDVDNRRLSLRLHPSPGCPISLTAGDDDWTVELARRGEDELGLRCGVSWLTADLNGALNWSAVPAYPFQALDEGRLSLLRRLTEYQWMSRSQYEAASALPFTLEENLVLRFGSERYRFSEFSEEPIENGSTDQRVRVFSDKWKLSVFDRISPLIYYAAFGTKEIFDCLRYSLISLLTFSGVELEIAIITRLCDKIIVLESLRGFSERWMSNIHVVYVEAESVYDFTMARYNVACLEELGIRRPVIYIDTDVLCDASLAPMIRQALRTTSVLVTEEEDGSLTTDLWGAPELWGKIQHPSDFWGKTLFDLDHKQRVSDQDSGINTGVLGAASADILMKTFTYVREVAERWHSINPAHFPLYDQPLAVYALSKSGTVERALWRNHVRLNGHDTDPDLASRVGLVHFPGGVGNAIPKVARMKSYLAKLIDELPSELPGAPANIVAVTPPPPQEHVPRDPYAEAMFAILELDIRCFHDLRAKYGSEVLHGPFKGMKVTEEISWGDASLKLLGLYEHYLHPVLAEMRSQSFDIVVNGGCGEGYYAVGLGLLNPEAFVFAYDADLRSQAICRRMAVENGIADRVEVGGLLTADVLADIAGRYRRPLFVIDVEGAEDHILSEQFLPSFSNATILCECHDFMAPGMTERLAELFSRSHDVVVIQETDLRATDVAEIAALPPILRMSIACETRPERMRWIYCRSLGRELGSRS